MSTSLLLHGFKVYDCHYEKTEYKEGNIYFTIKHNPEKLKCSNCHSFNVINRGIKERQFRTLSIGNKKVFLKLNIQRVECKKCGLVRQVELSFADQKKTYTKSFENYVLELCRYMTIQDVAQHLDVNWDTIKQIQKRNLQKRYANPNLDDLTMIAIDEIAVKKGHKYLTVVLNLETGVIVYVGEGKGSDALKGFWDRLKKKEDQNRSSSNRYVPGIYILSEGECVRCNNSL
jgi:transposase